MSKILVIGDIYSETQYFVDNVPEVNQFALAESTTTVTGSKTINASRILTRLGDKVKFFGRVGDDDFGKLAIDNLNSYGLDTSTISIVKNSQTGKIVVVTDKEGRSSITLCFGANEKLDPNGILHVKEIIKDFDGVYAATNLVPESLYNLVRIVKEAKVPIFLDFPNRQKEIELEKISEADFVAPNRHEAELITGITINNIDRAKEAINWMAEKLKRNILITLDQDGVLIFDKQINTTTHLETAKVESVDDTASGDIFRAVFFSNYLTSKDIISSAKKGVMIATESITIKGVDKTLREVKL